MSIDNASLIVSHVPLLFTFIHTYSNLFIFDASLSQKHTLHMGKTAKAKIILFLIQY